MKAFQNGFAMLVISFVTLACNLTTTPDLDSKPTAFPPSENPTLVPATASIERADIIFHNGVILTMDAVQPSAQAIAIRGETILSIGSDAEVLSLGGAQTELIDLGGLTLMPGFVDAHNHMLGERLMYDEDPLPEQQMAIESGVTTTAEFYVDQSILNKLASLAKANKLRVRVNAYLLYNNNCGDLMGDWWKNYQPNQQIAPNLFVRGIKIFTDGGSCKIPAISVEYPGGGKGDLFLTQEQLDQIVEDIQVAGFQVAIHTLGDRSLEQAQNAIAAALNGSPNIYRHRIEHNAIIRPELLKRYGEIGIIPVIFGGYPTCIRTTDESKFKYLIPSEYGEWEWPWRALVDANPNLPIAWQSDYPLFDNINPIYQMWGMVTRKAVNTDGSICNPPDWLKKGALRVEEVLPIMTINSAYSFFLENEVGSLQMAKFADLIILSENPLISDPDKLKDINVLMTIIAGKVEYCAAGSESLCPSASPSEISTASSTSLEPVSALTTASASLPNNLPFNAFDENIETIWNSGAGPEQWIRIDLGELTTVSRIRLFVSQFPEGETIHQIWVSNDGNNFTIIHEFKEVTVDPEILEFKPSSPLTDIRYIKVVTTQSPSWVAWREIEITK